MSPIRFLFFLGVVLGFSVVAGRTVTSRDKLFEDLMEHYHSGVEPSGVVDLKFGLSLMCVRFDNATGELTTNAWERYTWVDFRLSWDPKDYDGIRKLRIPAKHIWKPDIDCYSALEIEGRSSENVLIEDDGTVVWIPRAYYKTLCTIEDEKPSCDLSFGSWTYDQWILAMELDGQGVDLGSYMNGTCPWTVDSHQASIKTNYYPCCKEPYSTLDIFISLKPHVHRSETVTDEHAEHAVDGVESDHQEPS